LPPILFLTSRVDEADIVAGLTVGADDYLAKPLRPANSWRVCARCCVAPIPIPCMTTT
jgi:DNA-binding response OmpR family regulator